ncbi:hypothetical protein BSLA_02f1967 [Burkholderia stabilis]|nr:hypothetical protein BSLA_02f1967 [Burkholderia stabilis]
MISDAVSSERCLGLVEQHQRVPVGARHGPRAHQLRVATDADLDGRGRGCDRRGAHRAEFGRHVGDRLQRELRVRVRNDVAVAVDQHPEAGGRRADRLHVRDHAVHRDVRGDDALQRAVAQDRHRERDHQVAGAGIDVRRRDNRLAGLRGLLVPRAAGRIVVGRDAGRVGEAERLVGVTRVDVRETAGRGHLLEHRQRIGRQRGILQRRDHPAPGGDPVGDPDHVAARDRGQVAVDRVVVVRACDDVVDQRGGDEREYNDGDARGKDAGADGREHGNDSVRERERPMDEFTG